MSEASATEWLHAADERSVAADRFFQTIKDFIELLKGWGLAAAILGSGFVVVESKLPVVLQLLSAMACLVTGTWVVIGSVLLFCRGRMAIIGLTRIEQAKRVLAFTVLMLVGLAVAYTTVEVLKPVRAEVAHIEGM